MAARAKSGYDTEIDRMVALKMLLPHCTLVSQCVREGEGSHAVVVVVSENGY
jgi:hypothetical protein